MSNKLQYWPAFLKNVRNLGERKNFQQILCGEVVDGDFCEFGVRKGESIRTFLKYLGNNTIFGFDSWLGLPEPWEGFIRKNNKPILAGKMKCAKPEFNDERVVLIEGWFSDTLPEWKYNKILSLVNIDCDIYSSTVTVLKYIKPFINHSTIIIFDEFSGYSAYEQHEYKAFQEFITENHLKYEYIARSDDFIQVAVKVKV